MNVAHWFAFRCVRPFWCECMPLFVSGGRLGGRLVLMLLLSLLSPLLEEQAAEGELASLRAE